MSPGSEEGERAMVGGSSRRQTLHNIFSGENLRSFRVPILKKSKLRKNKIGEE